MPKKVSLAEHVKQPKTLDNAPHVMIQALAGSGKSVTIIEGVRLLLTGETRLDPSPQQRAIWDAICLSRGKAKSICFAAFNKTIATHLKKSIPPGCDATTLHSLGFSSIRRNFQDINVDQYRLQKLTCEVLGQTYAELRKEKFQLLYVVEKIVRLCKLNMIPIDIEDEQDEEAVDRLLQDLVDYYDIDMEDERTGGDWTDEAFSFIPAVLDRCKQIEIDKTVDFDDQVWLPVILGLDICKYDLLLVDEFNDLSICQRELVKKSGHRFIMCGDSKQSLYQFAGADSKSIQAMEDDLSKSKRGCITLPLTMTYRCGKAIVEEAKKFVPTFEAHPNNPPGLVRTVSHIDYLNLVQDGDFVLCRVTAPLVRECFAFIRQGRRANIIGRDIGQGLLSLIRKMKAYNTYQLRERIQRWREKEFAKEMKKSQPNDNKLLSIQDKFLCIQVFMENADDINEVYQRVQNVFDSTEQYGEFISLSTIHKAKGLEARRVFILQGKDIKAPSPKTDWQREQNANCQYVAITRAIEELYYVE